MCRTCLQPGCVEDVSQKRGRKGRVRGGGEEGRCMKGAYAVFALSLKRFC